ncbi:MAG: helix-turn-helix domain-containing protein, partial [Schaedlerella arabinosiphila]|nr:helix-turn-helix domain-containing protein [Schaedlerella arabinosiphila]
MQIGEVIRKHRKLKNLTQEEMAARLGVTAPAVNKWENGNSFPDIMLLAPIARLLGITVDTLLSFREELTAQEIGNIIYEMERKL